MTVTALIPDKTYQTAAILRISTVMATMLMVREGREAEADELSQSPSLKWPRMSARCRWIKKLSAVAEKHQGGLPR